MSTPTSPTTTLPEGPATSALHAGASAPEPAVPAARGPLAPADERNWAMGAHLSAFVTVWLGFLSFLGPLTVLLVAGNRSAFVRRQAVEALNFNLSMLIYGVVALLSVIVLIGLVLVPAVLVAWFVLTIVAAANAQQGHDFRYPLTIRLVS